MLPAGKDTSYPPFVRGVSGQVDYSSGSVAPWMERLLSVFLFFFPEMAVLSTRCLIPPVSPPLPSLGGPSCIEA